MAKLLSLPAAYNQGMEAFSKHCLRYGSVLGYNDYIDENDKECRIISVMIQGCHAEITKRTGEVVACSYIPNN